MDRGVEMVEAVLGVWRAGGAYVPLDVAYPKERLKFMVVDSGMRWVLSQRSQQGVVAGLSAEVLYVEEVLAEGKGVEGLDLGGAKPEDLAYVIYTSGSTGKPKGVEIWHGAVVNFLEAMGQRPGMEAGDVILSVTTLSFDIVGLELFLPLSLGARVVLASREETVDAVRLGELIRSSGATVMQATPVTWRMLLDGGWHGERRLKVLCGGEALDRELAQRLRGSCGEVWNLYGPTETTIWSTVHRVEEGEAGAVVSIGRPIANTRVYILDGWQQPVPIGVVGDLYVGGEGLARGYLNRPELTAERFVADPFSLVAGARMYRTGDLARYRADGRIEYLGREDFQVKVRGHRIELGEIEAVLGSYPGVRQAVVVAREVGVGDQRLVGYWVGEAGVEVGVQGLRGHLVAALPEYMVPVELVKMAALPLTPNGKINRQGLPETAVSEVEAGERYVAPLGGVEEALAKIWRETLKVERVGREDDFFELGGHSLLAVRLFAGIEREFGQRLPLATLFAAPTLAGLAREIQAERHLPNAWKSLVSIQPGGSRPPLFCIHGGGGNVLLYRGLARHLGKDQPFYGLQSLGLDGRSQILTTIEEMAASYLKEIRGVSPSGPYFLGGYCLGGLVAYEIAQRLLAQGQTVALLALFDTYNLSQVRSPYPLRARLNFYRQKTAFHWSNFAQLSNRARAEYLGEKARMAREAIMAILTSRWNRVGGGWSHREGKVGLWEPIEAINDRAAYAYQPLPYGGRLTLFKPQRNYDFYPDPNMGWVELAKGGLDVITLPVNPHAMLAEPFVHLLATEIGKRLDRSYSSPTVPLLATH
jgi:amino acid adenylation domain-containing protein